VSGSPHLRGILKQLGRTANGAARHEFFVRVARDGPWDRDVACWLVRILIDGRDVNDHWWALEALPLYLAHARWDVSTAMAALGSADPCTPLLGAAALQFHTRLAEPELRGVAALLEGEPEALRRLAYDALKAQDPLPLALLIEMLASDDVRLVTAAAELLGSKAQRPEDAATLHEYAPVLLELVEHPVYPVQAAAAGIVLNMFPTDYGVLCRILRQIAREGRADNSPQPHPLGTKYWSEDYCSTIDAFHAPTFNPLPNLERALGDSDELVRDGALSCVYEYAAHHSILQVNARVRAMAATDPSAEVRENAAFVVQHALDPPVAE
jgi:hypothetical protein